MNSNLVSYVKYSPNNYGVRTHKIDRITPHCVVGQCSIEALGNLFAKKSTYASSNYGIGVDGRVGLFVDEDKASYCSSSKANDERAVTIECASDNKAPYAFKPVVYEKLIELCTDICRRNGKKKLLWCPDKATTLAYVPKEDEMVLTVHRWFANKSCPGDWLYSRMSDLAARVTANLGSEPAVVVRDDRFSPYYVQIVKKTVVRAAASGDSVARMILGSGVFTIVEEKNGFGKLKSGAGWVDLGTVRRV